jgi:hypothetical protein
VTNKHHIKLNNKVYDAITGKLVDKQELADTTDNSAKAELKRHSKKSGARVVSEPKKQTNQHTHLISHSQNRTRKAGNIDHSNLHSKQSKSKILMRKTVRKPQKIKAKSTPTTTVLSQKQNKTSETTKSKDLLRQKKAQNIQKHQMVRKFNHHGHHTIDGISTQIKPLPMAQAPEAQNEAQAKHSPTQQAQPLARIDSFVNPKKCQSKSASTKKRYRKLS